MVQATPEGFGSVTSLFTFKNCKKAIEFYQSAFNASLISILPTLDGKGTMHAVLKIGNTQIMMGDEMPNDNCSKSAETIGTSPISLFLYVEDAYAAFQQAIAAGAQGIMPVTDMFWGDRVGQIKDPFGYNWMIGTHTVDLTPEQIKENAEQFFASMNQ